MSTWIRAERMLTGTGAMQTGDARVRIDAATIGLVRAGRVKKRGSYMTDG